MRWSAQTFVSIATSGSLVPRVAAFPDETKTIRPAASAQAIAAPTSRRTVVVAGREGSRVPGTCPVSAGRSGGFNARVVCGRVYFGPVDERVENQLKRLPAKPGVYLFRSERGDVLYVGKAKSLRPRVRQYFQPGRTDNRMGMD